MKVAEFKNNFKAIQKESREIAKAIKPYLKKLKNLSKKCELLSETVAKDDELFKTVVERRKNLYGEFEFVPIVNPDGWDINALLWLRDFEHLEEALDDMDEFLVGMKHAQF